MSSTKYLIVVIGILAAVIEFSGVMKEKHSNLNTNPNGEQMPPNFRGLKGENFFKNKLNLWVHYRKWLPYPEEKEAEFAKSVKAVVFMQHSLMHHSEMFQELAKELNKENIAVYAYDYVGYGLSEGDRKHTTIQDEIENTIQLMDLKKPIHGKEKVFLLGVSAGGSISTGVAIKRPSQVNGVVVMSSSLGMPLEAIGETGFSLIGLLAKYFPRLPVLPLSMKEATRDEKVVKQLEEDSSVNHGLVPLKLVYSYLKFLNDSQPNFSKIQVPMLFACGTGDIVTPCAYSEAPYKAVGSKDKSLKLYEGGKHHLFDELNKEEVISDVKNWILGRI